MENEKRSDSEDEAQRRAHSLPGTNQAGNGAAEEAPSDREPKTPDAQDEQRNAHSLPGTNQAGKS